MPDRRRVALVTGGAKRVGRAIVERLGAMGFAVAFTYLTSDRDAEALRSQLAERGIDTLPIKADLAEPENAVEQIDKAFGSWSSDLDVLVNNASLWLPGRLAETTPDILRKAYAVHVESPLLLCKTFANRLRRDGGGHVVNMVDLLAERPWPQYLAYCASKAALANLTLGLSRELAPQVTVNGIAPGVVQWPEDFPADEREKYLKRVPLQREGTPADVANLVEFLVGKGSYITGQIIRLDGGRSVT
ncbi:SDR family oxidoreductase [Humisphaera borealis]|uniref:SDR family oxidoreductase n=1 Tax=Humisphaera borealis TaxID=2807512 RepID=A0A7M2WYL5_9BACT|nr:SDR family oxidoreductase [Humisphaera borealis]QOV89931.1 SDR family oxidoreductase [Humisphaera borealis]